MKLNKAVRIGTFAGTIVLVALGVTSAYSAHSAAPAEAVTPISADAASLYTAHCAKCHGKDGRAKSMHGKMVGAQNLTDPKWQADTSDEHIFNSISKGKGSMPAFGKKLSAAEIDSLVSYVRQFKK
jgi:mono/diheme cytochrome c family protein